MRHHPAAEPENDSIYFGPMGNAFAPLNLDSCLPTGSVVACAIAVSGWQTEDDRRTGPLPASCHRPTEEIRPVTTEEAAIPTPHDELFRDALLVAFTFATGIVDAVSYLGLGSIFTANMTGNTVFLALAIGQRNLLAGAHSADALVGFAVGAIIAGRMIGSSKRTAIWPPSVTRVFGGELALLVLFNLGWVLVDGAPTGPALYALIALSSIAMGMQSAAARYLAAPGLTTNVLTTAFTGLMAESAALGIAGSLHRRWTATVVFLFGGAAVGGALLLTVRTVPPFLTTATVAAVCILGYVHFHRPVDKSAIVDSADGQTK